MTFRRNFSNVADDLLRRINREKAGSNQRIHLQPAVCKIFIRSQNQFVQTGHLLAQLAADTANQKIAERRKHSQKDCRTRFSLAVRLRQRDEDYVPFFHWRGGVSRSTALE